MKLTLDDVLFLAVCGGLITLGLVAHIKSPTSPYNQMKRLEAIEKKLDERR